MRARRCDECGGTLTTKILPFYQETLLGLKDVVLVDAVEETCCEQCGGKDITIPNLPGLVAATAVARVKSPLKLSGSEIRFLRKALELTAKQLAAMLEVREETVSRWENGKDPIGPSSEKLLRLIVGLGLAKKAPAIEFNEKEIMSMQIQSVRPHDRSQMMAFRCVKMRIDHRKEEAWEESLQAA